jgi:hypothetical protein
VTRFLHSEIICLLHNMAYLSCMVVEGLKNGFPKQDVNMSLVLSLVREISVLFDTGDAVNAVGMCSLE